MDQRDLVVYGIAFVLIGTAIYIGGRLARRHLKPLGTWSVTLWGNALLAGGLTRLMKAGVLPGGANAARWLDDGVFVLGMAGFICFLLQAVRDSRVENAQVRTAVVASDDASPIAAIQTDAAHTGITTTEESVPQTVGTVGQGRS